MTFNFTHADTEVQSNLVGEAYYNDSTRELVVLLGYDGEAYKYDGVPLNVYNELVSASSVGGFYNRVIKRDYGPGTYLGSLGWDNTSYFINGYKAPAMAAPVVNEGPYLTLAPEGLSTSGGHFTVTSDEKDGSYFSLVAPNAVETVDEGENFTLRHEVVFTVNGTEDEKTYSATAESVDEATKALFEVAGMLDVQVRVRRVTVYFE